MELWYTQPAADWNAALPAGILRFDLTPPQAIEEPRRPKGPPILR